MSDKKRAMILGAAAVVIVLVLLLRARGGASVVNQAGDYTTGNVILPAFTLPLRGGGPILVNGLRSSPLDFTMIGACCADCSGASPRIFAPASTTRITFVTNEGNKGPNIFVAAPPPSYGGGRRSILQAG